LTCFCTWP